MGVSLEALEAERPIVQSILVLEHGHLLVQIAEEAGRDGSVFDVFDPDGRFLGSVDFGFAPATLGVTTFRGDTIFAPTIGAQDVPYVVKAVIERPPRSAAR